MQSQLSRRRTLAPALLAFALASCQTYSAPGAPAELALFDDLRVDDDIEAAFELQPAAAFPATIALARVQAPGYASHSHPRTSERGKYAVITTREIEADADLQRILAQPQVAGVATFSRMIAPAEPQTERELRAAAARLRADLLLVYTLDSAFRREGRLMPLAVLSLGLLATDKVHLTSTASALLVDTRTGFVYGTAEATAREDEWQHLASARSYDAQRLDTEREAFQRLVGEFETLWQGVLRTQGIAPSAAEPAAAPEAPADDAAPPGTPSHP